MEALYSFCNMAHHLWTKVGYNLRHYFIDDNSFDFLLRFPFALVTSDLPLSFRALNYRGQMMVFLLKCEIILKHYEGSFLFEVCKYLTISNKYFRLLSTVIITGLH